MHHSDAFRKVNDIHRCRRRWHRPKLGWIFIRIAAHLQSNPSEWGRTVQVDSHRYCRSTLPKEPLVNSRTIARIAGTTPPNHTAAASTTKCPAASEGACLPNTTTTTTGQGFHQSLDALHRQELRRTRSHLG